MCGFILAINLTEQILLTLLVHNFSFMYGMCEAMQMDLQHIHLHEVYS